MIGVILATLEYDIFCQVPSCSMYREWLTGQQMMAEAKERFA